MLQELVSTPEGTYALFIFILGGALVGGVILVALSSRGFRNMMSEMFLGGIKCKVCKKRPEKWIHWTDRKGETGYTGYEWCPFCGAKRYEGFQDRCF